MMGIKTSVCLLLLLLLALPGFTQSLPHWAQIQGKPIISPEEYRAEGDGVTDDSTAMQNAITAAASAGAVLLLPNAKEYLINGTLTIDSALSIVSSGGTLKKGVANYLLPILVVRSSGVQISGVTFDGNDLPCQALVYSGIWDDWATDTVRVPYSNIVFDTCTFKDVAGTGETAGGGTISGATQVDLYNLDVAFNNCTFSNIFNTAEDASLYFSSGVLIAPYPSTSGPTASDTVSKIRIDNCLFKDIFTKTSGAGTNDADAIRVYTETFTDKPLFDTFVVSNTRFERIGKRILKTFGHIDGGIQILNCTLDISETTTSDGFTLGLAQDMVQIEGANNRIDNFSVLGSATGRGAAWGDNYLITLRDITNSSIDNVTMIDGPLSGIAYLASVSAHLATTTNSLNQFNNITLDGAGMAITTFSSTGPAYGVSLNNINIKDALFDAPYMMSGSINGLRTANSRIRINNGVLTTVGISDVLASFDSIPSYITATQTLVTITSGGTISDVKVLVADAVTSPASYTITAANIRPVFSAMNGVNVVALNLPTIIGSTQSVVSGVRVSSNQDLFLTDATYSHFTDITIAGSATLNLQSPGSDSHRKLVIDNLQFTRDSIATGAYLILHPTGTGADVIVNNLWRSTGAGADVDVASGIRILTTTLFN